jgi:hypothetical protein
MEWEHGPLGSLLVPEILTPEQYAEERRTHEPSPVKRLMLAVLEDALRCFQRNIGAKVGSRQLIYSEAERWLCVESGEAIFSFKTVCEAVGIDPDYLRAGLLQWRGEQQNGTARKLTRRSPVTRDGPILSVGPRSRRPNRRRPFTAGDKLPREA